MCSFESLAQCSQARKREKIIILYIYSSPLVPDEDNTNVHYLALQLDEGVYTGTELATELKTNINGVVDNTNFLNTYEISYSVKTKK